MALCHRPAPDPDGGARPPPLHARLLDRQGALIGDQLQKPNIVGIQCIAASRVSIISTPTARESPSGHERVRAEALSHYQLRAQAHTPGPLRHIRNDKRLGASASPIRAPSLDQPTGIRSCAGLTAPAGGRTKHESPTPPAEATPRSRPRAADVSPHHHTFKDIVQAQTAQ